MRAAVALAAGMCLASSGRAAAEPSDKELVAGGLVLALPTYMLGVSAHEGSHALAAKLMGAEVTEVHLWPGRNPHNGAFQFGWVRVRGLRSDRQRIAFLAAPKVTDLAVLGGWSALYLTDSMPDNRWGGLAIQVVATGFWVDFTKDVFVFDRHNDVVRIYTMLGLDSEWKRLPARALHAAASAGLGYLLWLGWRDLFRGDDAPVETTTAAGPPAAVFPVISGSF